MQNRKILCVDTDRNILDLLTFNLEASGYTVETTMVGTDALKTDASLILLDPHLSDLGGFNLFGAVRSTPVIIVTENDNEDEGIPISDDEVFFAANDENEQNAPVSDDDFFFVTNDENEQNTPVSDDDFFFG